MRITLIDGSPKIKNSSSGKLLNLLKTMLEPSSEIFDMKLGGQYVTEEQKQVLKNSDRIIFSFPLYVDGVPGHLLSCLMQLEEEHVIKSDAVIYAIVNCGFYEGIQAEPALCIVENWCAKAGIRWGGGVGAGGGGAMDYIPVTGKGPFTTLGKKLCIIAENIETGKADDNFYTQPNFPRWLYKIAAQKGWRDKLKANGVKKSELGRRF